MIKRVVEAINGGDNSIDSKNINPNKKAIHICGGMEHNLAGYAKYYSYGSIEISRSSEGKLITIEEIFLDIGEQMLETSYILNLRHLLEIAHELKIYLW
jgi:hypothetical protein